MKYLGQRLLQTIQYIRPEARFSLLLAVFAYYVVVSTAASGERPDAAEVVGVVFFGGYLVVAVIATKWALSRYRRNTEVAPASEALQFALNFLFCSPTKRGRSFLWSAPQRLSGVIGGRCATSRPHDRRARTTAQTIILDF